MASIGGSNIVKDGLVLHLDAANNKSYVSGSTTWRDLSGNNNNATSSSPQYSGSNGGSLYFPNNTTSLFNTPSYTLVPNNGITMETFVYPTSDTFSSGLNGILGFRNTQIWALGILGLGSSGRIYIQYGGLNTQPYDITVANTWYHLVVTLSTTSINLYVNGINRGLLTGTYSTPSDTAAFTIGKWVGGFQDPLKGNVAIVRWYNRPLSALEVQQNFNATKGRFNL
jgi:hypothetical protein